jgi:tetratricopeptide (TPR) repeat protein
MKDFLTLAFLSLSTFTFAQGTDSSAYFYNKGLEDKNAGRFLVASNQFNKAIQYNANYTDAYRELGASYVQMNKYTQAIDAYTKVIEVKKDDTSAIRNLAQLYLWTRQWQQAINYSQQMQQMKLANQPMSFIIAKAYYEMENYGEALRYCEAAFREEPRRAEVPYIAGRCLVEMSNYKKAAGCYEQALERDSTNVNWMYEAGMVFYSIPDDKKAIYWFEKAGDKGYKRTNDYVENLANAYLNTKNFEKGKDLLLEVLQKRPADQELLYNVADAFYRCGKYDDAIGYWDKVLEIDKTKAGALYMIGMAYQKKGDKAKGTALCDKAIQMDPSLSKLKQEMKMPGSL